MKLLFVLLLAIGTGKSASAQKNEEKIHAAIVGFFNGMSLINADTLHRYATTDFQLLEEGLVWNMDSLVKAILPRKNAGIVRRNSFEFIRTEYKNGIAWVSYKNTAEFQQGGKRQTVRWLESVVLRKQQGEWKIQLMHSSKLK
ncbi:MAG: hypothetical protein JWQ27_350 [Ferruginibacter sp.]|nr:hypothetical protein [Ferruginibacter sp.]